MPGFIINGTGNDRTVDAKKDIYRSYRWNIRDMPFLNRERWGLILDCTLPSIDFDVLLVQGQSLEYKIPQKPTFPNADITFYDLGLLQKEFETWIDKIWNPTKGLFDGKAPTEIKKVIKLDLLDNGGSAIKNFELHGAWPKRLTHSKLSMSDESLKTLVVEFVYDFYIVKDGNNSNASVSAVNNAINQFF